MMACAIGCPLKVSEMMMQLANNGMYNTVSTDTATWLSREWCCSPPSWLNDDSRRALASVLESLPATASGRRLPTLIFALAAMATRMIDTMMLRDIVMRWYGE